MPKTLCISADSHVVEPPELFAPLEKRFGERAPRIRYTKDRGPQLDLGDGRLGLAIGGFLQAGFDFGRPDFREILKKGYELARPGVYDINARMAAQDLKMPLTMHIFTGATDNHGLPFKQAGSALAFAGVMFSIADLIQGGVCERFPDLRFVVTEFETGWLGIMLKRLDWSWFRFGGG